MKIACVSLLSSFALSGESTFMLARIVSWVRLYALLTCFFHLLAAKLNAPVMRQAQGLNLDQLQFLNASLVESTDGFLLNVLWDKPDPNVTIKPKIEIYASIFGPQDDPQDGCALKGLANVTQEGDVIKASTIAASGLPTTPISQATGLDVVQVDLGATEGNTTITFSFNNLIDTNPELYLLQADGTAKIQFCIRQYIDVALPEGGSVDVDTVDLPLDFTVDLNAQISLTPGFDVQSYIDGTQSVATSYSVTLYTCDLTGDKLVETTPTFNQGDVVDLCLKSDDYPKASISDIDALTFALGTSAWQGITPDLQSSLVEFDPATSCTTVTDGQGVDQQDCGIRVL